MTPRKPRRRYWRFKSGSPKNKTVSRWRTVTTETCRCDFWKNVLQHSLFFLCIISWIQIQWDFCSEILRNTKVQPDNGYGCASLLPALGDLKLSWHATPVAVISPAQGLARKTAWGVIDVETSWEDHSTTQDAFTSFYITLAHDLNFSIMLNHNQSPNVRYVESKAVNWYELHHGLGLARGSVSSTMGTEAIRLNMLARGRPVGMTQLMVGNAGDER